MTMNKNEMIDFIKENQDSCYCLIRANKFVGDDEETQKKQLEDYIDAGAKILTFESDYTETRQNKDIIKKIKHLRDIKYIICIDLTRLGTDIFWTLRLVELLTEKKISIYLDEFETTLEDYKMNYLEFIQKFVKDKKSLEAERALMVKAKNDSSKKSGGRPVMDIDEKKLAMAIAQYENGILTGRSAARKVGVSESTFRRRLDEYYKNKTL